MPRQGVSYERRSTGTSLRARLKPGGTERRRRIPCRPPTADCLLLTVFFVGDAHLGQPVAQRVAGEAEEARGLTLVAAGAAQGEGFHGSFRLRRGAFAITRSW